MSGSSGGGLVNPIYLINGIVNYTAPEAGTSGSSFNNYIPFTFNYPYAGVYGTRGISNYLPSGNICVPGDVVKLAPWVNSTSPTYGTSGQSLIYTLGNQTLKIESVSHLDWTSQIKQNWMVSFMKNCGLNDLVSDSALVTTLINHWESLDGYALLSGPSVSYVNRNLDTGEVSIGMNVYLSTFFQDWANDNNSLPESAQILSLLNKKESDNTQFEDFYLSNACKLTYKSVTDIAWCFNGLVYDYDTTAIVPAPDLKFGGGNVFGEIRFAGNEPKAHYYPRKRVHPDDPTLGLCSGVAAPFCIGDIVIIVDDSTWSGTSGNGNWQWVGDITQTKYNLHIADIKNPCVDYKSVPISEMLFPLRVIQSCIFDDFD